MCHVRSLSDNSPLFRPRKSNFRRKPPRRAGESERASGGFNEPCLQEARVKLAESSDKRLWFGRCHSAASTGVVTDGPALRDALESVATAASNLIHPGPAAESQARETSAEQGEEGGVGPLAASSAETYRCFQGLPSWVQSAGQAEQTSWLGWAGVNRHGMCSERRFLWKTEGGVTRARRRGCRLGCEKGIDVNSLSGHILLI